MNLPIAERELRVASRTARMYRGRVIAGVIFGAITGWVFWFAGNIAPVSTISTQTYAVIAHIALLMSTFSAVVTADALSSEKRNGTLGLLFLTDLRSVDIVFGKLAAFGVVCFYSLLATIPVLAMPLLMGGVSGQSVFRTAITLLNGLFFALSVGLWISARSWDQKRAVNSTIWVIIMLMWISPFAVGMLRMRPGWGQVADWIYVVSPMYQQDHASPFGIGMRTERYWTSFMITHALGWLALWRACALLPHAWQDRVLSAPVGRFKKFVQELRFGSPDVRLTLRRRLLEVNAVHWLSAREKFAPTNVWIFVAAVLAGWVGLWFYVDRYARGGPAFWALGIPATMILYLGLRVRACGIAGEVIARDRVNGALELLVSTTLTEGDIARGQMLTFTRTLLGPAIATMFIATAVFLLGLIDTRGTGLLNETPAWVVYFGMLILFVCDLVAAFWTGLWTGCVARNVQTAAGQAVLRLLAMPWLIFMLGMMCVGVLRLRFARNMEFTELFGAWWTLCMLNNVAWIFRSRRNFYERLRLAAAERFQPAPARSGWRRFFRRSEPFQEISLSKVA